METTNLIKEKYYGIGVSDLQNEANESTLGKRYYDCLNEALARKVIYTEAFYDALLEVSGVEQREEVIKLINIIINEPFRKKKCLERLEEIANFTSAYYLTYEELERKDLVDLYHIEKKLHDRAYQGIRGKLRAISRNQRVMIKLATQVLKTHAQYQLPGSLAEKESLHARNFFQMMQELRKHGYSLDIDYGDVDPEYLRQNPHIYYASHQGGGIEDSMVYAMFMEHTGAKFPRTSHHSVYVKNELFGYPAFGAILSKLEATGIKRAKLQNPETRAAEIFRLEGLIQKQLESQRGVLIFTEGTTSQDGNFASSPGRVKWASDIMGIVENQARNKGTDRIMIISDTLLAFPEPMENGKTWKSSKARPEAGFKFYFSKLPKDLKLSDNQANPFDEDNYFGLVRSKIKAIKIKNIKELMDQ